MVNVDRVLLVAVLAVAAAGAATLNSLERRIETLEARLAAPERMSAAAGSQGRAAVEELAALARTRDGRPQAAFLQARTVAVPPARPALASVDDMIGRLKARLRQNPKDTEGWRMLGWSYFQTGRYVEAAGAYARAADLDPDRTAFKVARGEALVKAAGDTVTDEARALFERALQLDPNDAGARSFLGAAEQPGGDAIEPH